MTCITHKRHRSKVKEKGQCRNCHVVRLSDRFWPLSQTKSPRSTKIIIGRMVAHPTRNIAHQVRSQKVKGQGQGLSTATANYKGLWSWVACGRGNTASAASCGGHTTCCWSMVQICLLLSWPTLLHSICRLYRPSTSLGLYNAHRGGVVDNLLYALI